MVQSQFTGNVADTGTWVSVTQKSSNRIKTTFFSWGKYLDTGIQNFLLTFGSFLLSV